MNKILKPIATGLLLIIVAGTFVELGLWQWHRAQSTSRQGKYIPPSTPIALTSVDQAGRNLSNRALNRVVTFTGHYVKNYEAPAQQVSGNGYKNLSVGLFEISDNRALLVVRGLNNGSIKATTQTLSVEGRIYPRQQEDHGLTNSTSLGRLDPALVAGIGGYNLFDGYVIASSERTATGSLVAGDRIPSPVQIQSISGFYWQHISYVVIWWFMAILTLCAPIIAKRSNRQSPEKDALAAQYALADEMNHVDRMKR
jgi:cytochrome oxidase assembly protein ShyY1